MFTGIIEQTGVVKKIEPQQSNVILWVEADFVNELKIDQSVAHNGVCLTVDGFDNGLYRLTAIKETLNRTNLGQLQPGDLINLERCMKADGRFDGHIVQGHVDTTASCKKIENADGSWNFCFTHDPKAGITVEKGSVTVNGISLTVVESSEDSFSVSIIPYTFEHTNLKQLKVGDTVNIEFDIIGKYLQKMNH